MAEFDDDTFVESFIFPKPDDYEPDDPETVRAMKSGYELDDF